MATTKKTTKKTVTKRFVTPKEYESIDKAFYALRGKAYYLAESGKLNSTAEKQLRLFVKGLDKAKRDTNWARATDYLKP